MRRVKVHQLLDSPAPHAQAQIELLWNVVALIPAGEVWTYGDVAAAAGLPGRARLAGRALKIAPPALHLPWHRVLRAGGRIAFAPRSSAFREQVQRLRAEGVRVERGRVVRPDQRFRPYALKKSLTVASSRDACSKSRPPERPSRCSTRPRV